MHLFFWRWCAALGGRALADSIANVETYLPLTSGTTAACVLDDYSGQFPVVTAVLSQPGVTDGHNYTSWSFLVNDGTGSALIYAGSAALSNGTASVANGGAGYTPTVGDALEISAKYSPYHQIPEIETLAAIYNPTAATISGDGDTLAINGQPQTVHNNATPGATVTTISAMLGGPSNGLLNQGTSGTLPLSSAGYLLESTT